MRNFLKIASGIDIIPLHNAIIRQSHLWNVNKLRTEHPGSAHKQVDDIWLRFNDLNLHKENVSAIIDEHESIFYPAWDALPECHNLIFDLMRMVRGVRLGRVLITRLAPGKQIAPHIDGGTHAAYYERYHLYIQNNPGSILRAESETVTAKAGDVWWFDNGKEHEVINNSTDDRICLIIDIACKK